MIAMVGEERYGTYFRGFTQKFWGVDPSALLQDLAAKKIRVTDEHEPFFGDMASYRPVPGFREFVRSLAHGLPVLHDSVLGLDIKHDRILHVHCERQGALRADRFVSTLRPDVLLGCNTLHVRGLTLVYAAVRAQAPFFGEEHIWWGYFPNHHAFTRITDMSRACCIDGCPVHLLCFEFPVDPHDVRCDSDFIQEARNFLGSSSISADQILSSHAVHVRDQAPVPSKANAHALRDVTEKLHSLANLFPIGRFGRFEFSWMKDGIGQGIALAEALSGPDECKFLKWTTGWSSF